MRPVLLSAAVLSLAISAGAQSGDDLPFEPEIPRTWDRAAMDSLELPLADPAATPVHLTPEQYYAIPVRPIYRSYPIYHPDREPPGYFEELRRREPALAWDRSALGTAADWRRAGELVFDAPVAYDVVLDPASVRDRSWYEKTGTPLSADGVMPFARYVVRERGKVEVGVFSCATCHSRIMPDGSLLKGAPSNFPLERAVVQFAQRAPLPRIRLVQRLLFSAPWIDATGEPDIGALTKEQILRLHAAMPPGVIARRGTSLYSPAQVPDLIGVRDRRYLDHTAVQRNRGVADVMRYAAINQGASDLASYGGFRPIDVLGAIPNPAGGPQGAAARYSDEQLYALALYVYSLEPPANPNRFDDLARRGQRVFEAERCDRCHTPPLYTNNRLTPAPGFEVPADHPDREHIMRRSVGTDPGLARRTRRGTGLYKVPSLRGLWYRDALEHDGSVRTLEEWFDPRRLFDDFEPSGWTPPGARTRAVRGHEFGLDLAPEERRALLAFLRTL